MEEVMNPHTCKPISPSPALAIRKESHLASKFKPKIRIVHIFAPEIIKTDVANFRELVQRLTGKPARRRAGKKKKAPATSSDVSESDASESTWFNPAEGMGELGSGPQGLGFSERLKEEEEEMWGVENSSFFGGLGDLDSFIQGLSEFPLVPLSSSHLDVFGETHLS
ncbi:VQ motif-containing protein 25-like [Magnolia sinica]|uniref:VQ motif-containing protein 25-like n=1 Tax=Magnolia sinica TaxID=86752 RepID=UPI00265AF64F|nr:VQ motif-containing protein 25-like [Magnolia sinica]